MNDGGRWDFHTEGEPFAFERLDAYEARRVRDRFTADMLYEYLGELGVPYDVEPSWGHAVLFERRGRSRPSPVGASEEHRATLARLRSERMSSAR